MDSIVSVVNTATGGHPWAAVGTGISIGISLLTGPLSAKFPFVKAWFAKSPVAGFLTPGLLSAVAVIGKQLADGASPSLSMLGAAWPQVMESFSAAALTFLASTNAAEKIAQAKEKGAASAAEVSDPKAALDLLGKGPQP